MTQFARGQSGNPGGRPKALRAVEEEQFSERRPLRGHTRKAALVRASALSHVKRAAARIHRRDVRDHHLTSQHRLNGIPGRDLADQPEGEVRGVIVDRPAGSGVQSI